jgi:hypothetical protein
MSLVLDPRRLSRSFGPAFGVLVIASVGLSLLTPLPLAAGLVLAILGPTLGNLLRTTLSRTYRFLGLLPPIAALGILVTYSRPGTVPELVAGIAGLAVLLWCSEEPDRSPGAVGRGVAALAVPAAVLGIALASSLLLPSGEGSLGIAAALLAVSVVAVALLLGAPRTFERDPSATS